MNSKSIIDFLGREPTMVTPAQRVAVFEDEIKRADEVYSKIVRDENATIKQVGDVSMWREIMRQRRDAARKDMQRDGGE